jgi:putative oxygen-independent coproporphyrinogen III oxidase
MVAAAARLGEWVPDPGFGVYVHIPFCLRRCHYCDFNTFDNQTDLAHPYVDALVADIERATDDFPPAMSVYFGGGTPTMLRASELLRLLSAIKRRIGVAPDAEITVEANPETVDESKFAALLEAGFNRFSIGVQSLAPHVLTGLGRTHDARTALRALEDARRAGAADVNADLIYGSVWESPSDWTSSLEGVLECGPDHISAYALTVEQATPLATMVATGRVPDVDPDVQAERCEVAAEILAAAGYERYEISNWARPGRASRHNVLYWCAGDYLGFGAGAHGHLSGRRSWSVRLPRDFIEAVAAGSTTEDGFEQLDAETRAREALILGLRLTSGVPLEGFAARWGGSQLARLDVPIAELEGQGLLETKDGRVRLTRRGTALANEVAVRLL